MVPTVKSGSDSAQQVANESRKGVKAREALTRGEKFFKTRKMVLKFLSTLAPSTPTRSCGTRSFIYSF